MELLKSRYGLVANSNSKTRLDMCEEQPTLRHAAVMQYNDNHVQQGLVVACCFIMLLLLPVFLLAAFSQN